ncbi:MAG: glycosyltransferase [Cyanobacteria bacterium Co-bin8]|nr:glycosyltransferase [Cyanobacteria bacterium Co-bin8]
MFAELSTPTWLMALAAVLLVLQLPPLLILLSRLLQGPGRRPPLQPQSATVDQLGSVSIVVPTLNEAQRIGPCLAGLSRQGYEVREVIVVDSRSTDGTPDLVKQAATHDPRFRLVTDDPLPPGWVGRPWALHTGFLHSSEHSQWILGIDADTQPQPGLVASLLQSATAEQYDLVSLAPQFILKTPGELWLQPALLMTLVYRFGPAGAAAAGAERVMANGQCFLCRRSLLQQLDGYTAARASFCDDVTLARYAAAQGARVGFWDGSQLLKVRMYEGIAETWREWGRSLDLKDAASPGQVWWDLWYLTAVQAMPWLVLPVLLVLAGLGLSLGGPLQGLLWINLGLIAVRFALQAAIQPSYDFGQTQSRWAFWLAPLADVPAVFRIGLSSMRQPTQWRGRQYAPKLSVKPQ